MYIVKYSGVVNALQTTDFDSAFYQLHVNKDNDKFLDWKVDRVLKQKQGNLYWDEKHDKLIPTANMKVKERQMWVPLEGGVDLPGEVRWFIKFELPLSDIENAPLCSR